MNRRETSGGQAIVMVTLALLAMCGMMGLAVDMGWSFFVHKQAQTAADAAALGATQEAINRISGNGVVISAFTCASGGTSATQADCQTTAVNCASVVATSNLNNGCQYAKKNGFDWTTSRQNVTIQSNDGQTANLPTTTAPGVVNMVYWVTVRTVQTVPQLFSAVLSHSEGTVSAVATAAIAASIGPGQFYGMNHQGDCLGWTGTPAGVLSKGSNCGVDVTLSPGSGKQTACGNGNANLCAPAGIILASQCNSQSNGVCDNGVAGDGGNNGVAMGSTLTIKGNNTVATDGAVTGTWNNMSGKALTPIYTMDSGTFADPTSTHQTSQPPLVSELGNNGTYPAIGSCGYPGGVIPANVTLGPYQYYSYQTVGGVRVPDGRQITFAGPVTFSNSGGTQCPDPLGTGNVITTVGASQGSSKFPTYIFYGGMNASGSNMTMGAGQYVMAGTKTQVDVDGQNKNVDVVFQDSSNNTITGDTNTGTMWVFTDANYPGMATQLANIPGDITAIQSLTQGSMYFKDAQISLSGLIGSANQGSNLPPGLDAYSGIVWWQDRRNSDVGYNQAANSTACVAAGVTCTGDDGTVLVCATSSDCLTGSPPMNGNNDSKLAKMLAANHVTATSPGLVMDPGNANIALQGVFYQPRGAWMNFVAGNSGFTCTPGQGGGTNNQCPLQVITGALLLDHGTVSLNLFGPTNPIIQYKPVLIH
jgi:Flp pilus assembly protein TadG